MDRLRRWMFTATASHCLPVVFSAQGATVAGVLSRPNRCLLHRTGVLHRHVHHPLLGSGADNPLSE